MGSIKVSDADIEALARFAAGAVIAVEEGKLHPVLASLINRGYLKIIPETKQSIGGAEYYTGRNLAVMTEAGRLAQKLISQSQADKIESWWLPGIRLVGGGSTAKQMVVRHVEPERLEVGEGCPLDRIASDASVFMMGQKGFERVVALKNPNNQATGASTFWHRFA